MCSAKLAGEARRGRLYPALRDLIEDIHIVLCAVEIENDVRFSPIFPEGRGPDGLPPSR